MEKIKAYTIQQRIILANVVAGKMQVQRFFTGETFGLLLENEPIEVDIRQLESMEADLQSEIYCVADLLEELNTVFLTKIDNSSVLLEFRSFEPKED